MDWSQHFASRTHSMQPSVIREILKLTQRSEVISFAGGLPAPQLFPVAELEAATAKVFAARAEEALQYGLTEGYTPLRAWVAERLNTTGTGVQTAVQPENVQIVSGSQQGLDFIAKIFLNPGDKVVVAAPTYMGALRAFDPYEPRYLAVRADDEGMLPEALEAALKQHPKFIYVIPNFDNPTGVTMSLARRNALIALAKRYGVPVVEDNPYGELRFEGEDLPHLYTLAPEQVIYCGSFSKIMVPGFRLAWVVANPEVRTLITRAKQAADLHTSTFTQIIAYEAMQDGALDRHLLAVRQYYKAQRDLMLGALQAHMPEGVRWTHPKGGMFLWCSLPGGYNATEIAYDALAQNVAYVPGETFFTGSEGLNTLRLSYSVATADEIDAGMKRLGAVFKEKLTPRLARAT